MSSKIHKKEVKPSDTPLAKEGKEKVNDLRGKIASEAQKIIHEIMPQRVCASLWCVCG